MKKSKPWTVYLSGPMTGLPDHNFPAFFEAEKKLRAHGYDVVNPAALGQVDGWEHQDYMRRDLPLLFTVDGISLLPGWERSEGALIEARVAQSIGLPILAIVGERPYLADVIGYNFATADGVARVAAGLKAAVDAAGGAPTTEPAADDTAAIQAAVDDASSGVYGQPYSNVQTMGRAEYASVLLEAQDLIHGDRQAHYGHPLDDFTRTGRMWGAVLADPVCPHCDRAFDHVDVTAEEVAMCMVGLKLSREVNRPKRDNLVDAAGYVGTLEMVRARRAEA